MSNLFVPGHPHGTARALSLHRSCAAATCGGGGGRASASRASASVTRRPRGWALSGTCRSSSREGQSRSRWSGRTARGKTTLHQAADPAVRADRRARSSSTARISQGLGQRPRFGGASASSSRTSTSTSSRCARTSASAASSTPRTSARRARGRPGRRGRAGRRRCRGRLDTPARPLVQGRRRAVGRPVAEGGARARVHARGGRHPGPRRADRGAGRRGRSTPSSERFRPAGPRPDDTARSPPSPTVRRADRIVVIEHGQIVEQGTHEELMAPAAATRTSSRSRRRATSERGRPRQCASTCCPRCPTAGRPGRSGGEAPVAGPPVAPGGGKYLELTAAGATSRTIASRSRRRLTSRPPGNRRRCWRRAGTPSGLGRMSPRAAGVGDPPSEGGW